MAFPSILSTLTNPNPTNRLNAPSHSGIETAQNTTLLEIERAIGTDSSILGTVIGDLRNPNSNGGGHVQTAIKGGTGQTSYIKGNLLVAQGTSVLSKLAPGLDGAVLKANSSVASGVEWGAVPGRPTVRVYSSASVLTWSRPSVLSYIEVEVQGGGSGGAGGRDTDTGSTQGGGAGGGGYSYKIIPSSLLGITETVTVGAGGSGGTATNNNGGGGGNSSFTYSSGASSIVGTAGAAGTSANGGAGGIGIGGDFNISGDAGGPQNNAGAGGSGGGSHMGGGGFGQVAAGNPGGQYGGGGSGGGGNSSGGATGGAGSSGVVIVKEY